MSLLPYYFNEDNYSDYLDKNYLNDLIKIYQADQSIQLLAWEKSRKDVFKVKPIKVKKVIFRKGDEFFASRELSCWTEEDVQKNHFKNLLIMIENNKLIASDSLKNEEQLWFKYLPTDGIEFTIEPIILYSIYCKNSYVGLINMFMEKPIFPYYTVNHYHFSPYYQLINSELIRQYGSFFSVFKPDITLFKLIEFSKTGRNSNLILDKQNALSHCHKMNECMALLQFSSGRPEIIALYQRFIKDSKRNIKVVRSYVKQLIKLFSKAAIKKLAVLELKLNVPEQMGNSGSEGMLASLDKAIEYRKGLIKFLQNQHYFDAIKGMIWRLDYDLFAGQYFYVFHLFLYSPLDEIEQLILKGLQKYHKSITEESVNDIIGIPHLSYHLLLNEKETHTVFINRILAHYERDMYGHVNTQGKKKVTFGKKTIVPISLKDQLKKLKKQLQDHAEELLG